MKIQKTSTREKAIPERKKLIIEELKNLIRESNAVMLASIKNLPARQFQQICKKLRGHAVVKVVRKRAIIKAIDETNKGAVKNLKPYVKEDSAIIFSKLDPFKLSAELSKSKSKSKAKVGQQVEEEVAIDAGPTELVPGPIISQLSGLGLKFQIEDGKITIRERKVILKAGDIVTDAAADIMGKFDIKPVSVGFEPIAAYDSKEEKVFENLKIDAEKTLDDLKSFYAKALAFAVAIAYPCKETISFLLAKASAHEKAIMNIVNSKQNSQGGQ